MSPNKLLKTSLLRKDKKNKIVKCKLSSLSSFLTQTTSGSSLRKALNPMNLNKPNKQRNPTKMFRRKPILMSHQFNWRQKSKHFQARLTLWSSNISQWLPVWSMTGKEIIGEITAWGSTEIVAFAAPTGTSWTIQASARKFRMNASNTIPTLESVTSATKVTSFPSVTASASTLYAPKPIPRGNVLSATKAMLSARANATGWLDMGTGMATAQICK